MNRYYDAVNLTDFTELKLVWENLTVTVLVEDDKRSEKLWRKFLQRRYTRALNILKEVSGYAETGNMFAILGPSGAGKTTLLAALAGRLHSSSGTVKINGHCSLKMGNSCSVLQRVSLGEELLRDFGLHECSDTVISKLSGGEKKRLSLAAELVTRPKILFIDEPTTGLDVFSATCVVQSLKQIALRGVMVFCTIHQPGMAIYNIFSHVILMADGRSVYFGILKSATEFFESQDYHCPANYDEAEYYVNILSRQNGTDRSVELHRAFSQLPFSKIPSIDGVEIARIIPRKKSGWLVQSYWLLWRICLQNKRTVFDNWITWFSYSLSIVFVGIFYAGTNSLTQEGIQNARGALYLTISEIIFTVAYSVVYELPRELVLYLRESAIYAPGPYYFTIVLGLIPKTTLRTFLFTIVIYFALQSEFWLLDFGLYYLCTTAAAVSGTAYGMMISSWVADVEVATTIMIMFDLLFLLTAGMFYNLRTMPNYLMYFKYASIFYYANEAISIIHWSKIKDIECPISYNMPCLLNGTEVLSEYGYNERNFWWDMIGLLLLTILMNIVGYLGTRRRRTLTSII
ncbi:Protein brown [Ooceraea biroi]|uniref:Protein brown n=1 Tax=Ooceraea biroi TaxID=2015173 RepID=A0A026WM99_OOCBI|nr:Protein brown [Ooceraea biroi]